MRMIVILTVICVIAGFLLGITYNVTVKKIELQKENLVKESLKAVIPQAVGFSQKINGKSMEYYEAMDSSGSVIGYAFMREGKGYSSIISIMIGIDKGYNIQNIKILSHNETPGLGTRIDEVRSNKTIWDLFKGRAKQTEKEMKEPWFQRQFREKPLDRIDAITGATITSKAVVNIVKNTIEEFKKEK